MPRFAEVFVGNRDDRDFSQKRKVAEDKSAEKSKSDQDFIQDREVVMSWLLQRRDDQ